MWEQFTTDFLTGIFIQKNTPPPPPPTLQTRVAGSQNQKSPVWARFKPKAKKSDLNKNL